MTSSNDSAMPAPREARPQDADFEALLDQVARTMTAKRLADASVLTYLLAVATPLTPTQSAGGCA